MKKNTRRIVLAALLIVAVICAVQVTRTLLAYQAGDKIYDQARNTAVTDLQPEDAEPSREPNLSIDFAALKEVNDEIIGWLWIYDSPINYPILHTGDNSKYLTTTYSGAYNSYGSIFMDYRNSDDFSDIHTLIHGHNMLNDAMFGTLRKFGDQAYYNERQFFYIYTPQATYKYAICSAYVTDVYSDSYLLDFADDAEHQAFLDLITRSSLIGTPEPLTLKSQIVTLSTCTSPNRKAERFVVHGLLVSVTPTDLPDGKLPVQ